MRNKIAKKLNFIQKIIENIKKFFSGKSKKETKKDSTDDIYPMW